MDDGIRKLDPAQFELLDGKLGGIDGAINKLAENISEPETSVAAEVSKLKDEVVLLRETLSGEFATSISALSDNLGKWLAAIALASSTPEDNSLEVQKQIDKHASDISAVRQTLQSSINRNQPKGE